VAKPTQELTATGVVKVFPGVRALDGVSFSLHRGEVHALLGENGAGKSTLMNVLAGVLQPDAGQLSLGGEEITGLTPHRARALGIGFIRQDPNVIDQLSVAENITLGSERHRAGVLSARADRERVTAHLRRLGIRLDPAAQVGRLSPAQRQLVAIAKVLLHEPRVLILDEPTAILTADERDLLFGLLRRLVADGTSVIYISHRLEEVFEIAHRATVLRDGRLVGTVGIGDQGVDRDLLVRMMVGRDLTAAFPQRQRGDDRRDSDAGAGGSDTGAGGTGDRASGASGTGAREGGLVVRGLLAEIQPDNPDLVVAPGEILGIAGLVGSGRTELLRAIFGADPERRLSLTVAGRPVSPASPTEAVAAGIALVPEDRRGQALIQALTIQENIALATPGAVASAGWISARRDAGVARRFMRALRVKAPGPDQVVRNLSGGNQQKVAIAKWLVRDARVLLLDEPTNGIDVGARAEIYRLLVDLADEGRVIVVVSSELPELLGLSDRIIVMRAGRVAAYVERAEARQEQLLEAALGKEVA
jgi:ABC-type sugar transport system ATPase subunit